MTARSEFEAGQMLGREQERERLATYFHNRLAPDLMALAFLIEAVRLDLETETHPAGTRLKKICDSITEMLQSVRENILDLGAGEHGNEYRAGFEPLHQDPGW
jgi:signal transduction histidine kinase